MIFDEWLYIVRGRMKKRNRCVLKIYLFFLELFKVYSCVYKRIYDKNDFEVEFIEKQRIIMFFDKFVRKFNKENSMCNVIIKIKESYSENYKKYEKKVFK